MPKPTTYLVRLQPYNKRRGFLVRNYTYRGVRFTERWKEVSAAVASELRSLIQPHDEEAALPLFDIKTREEAAAVESDERDGALGVARIKQAERVPDRSFRDDKPKVDEETGEIYDDIEPAEEVDSDDQDDDENDAEPAPSIRGNKRARSRR